MRINVLLGLLVVVAALSVVDAGLIRLIVRGIKIGTKAIVAAVTGGGTATVVTTAVLTTADLALNIANVVSKGCMYEKEICSLTPEIENLEKQIAPLYNQLTLLDEKNTKMYNDLEKNFNKQNELAQQANKVQQLVLSIIQKIGDPVMLNNLARDAQANVNALKTSITNELQQYQKSLEGKAVMSSIADSTLLIVLGAKTAYSSLKAAGKISSTVALKTVKFPTGLTTFTKPGFVKTIGNSLSSVKTFFKKPSVTKFVKKVSSGGMVLGSLVGLGVTLGVDISQAKKMKDSLKNTRDEMKQTLVDVQNEIKREQQVQRDLAMAFSDVKNSYRTMVAIVNPSLKNKLNADGGSTPWQLYNYQVQAINVFKKLNQELESMNINFSVIEEVVVGVELNDAVSRIRSTIERKNLGKFTEAQIYNIIAEQFPQKSSYQGHNLRNYRG